MREVKWRLAEERDTQALNEMHAELERKVGRKMDRPDLLKEPVICAVVGELDGVIVQGLYAEAEIEVCACSPHALSPRQMTEGVKMLASVAQDYKIRIARCFVPDLLVPAQPERPSAIERTLNTFGFDRGGKGFQQFFLWLSRRERT